MAENRRFDVRLSPEALKEYESLDNSVLDIVTKEYGNKEGVMYLTGKCGIRKGTLADQTEYFTRQREYSLKLQGYKKGDILINPRTRAYRIYGYGDDNLSSFRITNTDEKKYYLDYLKEVGLQPIPVRKKK